MRAGSGRPWKIPFLGDEAVLQAGQVLVVRGPWFFTLSINQSMTAFGRLRVSAGLARKIVARLDAAGSQRSSSAR